MNAPVAIDTRFTVPGMRCAGCIGKIERDLPRVAGIASARVNFSAKRVAIRHDAALDEADLTQALRAIGFEAHPVAADPLARSDDDSRMLMRALAVAGFGMMNVMLLSVSVWAGASGPTRDLFHWLSAIIALPVIAYAGRPFFASALMALRYGRTNMDVPISIGVLLATGLSVYETLSGGAHAYFESAVMLLFFLLCGRALDATMRNRTRAGIGALLGRVGSAGTVIEADGSTRRVPAAELEAGMLVMVAAGEALAADGTVETGSGAIDNAMLTGESAPEQVQTGSLVHAGAINLDGPLSIRLTAVADDTALAEIARLMDEAGQSRSHYVRIADRASRLYAPAVHSLALLAFVGWIVAGAGWYQSLVIAIAVLIITCPCAIGLAVPAAQVVAAGALIKRGLLIKDGSALERLAEVDIALFDKTGTLTYGTPRADISMLDNDAKAAALALAQASRHPLSIGLASALRAAGTMPCPITDLHEEAGSGVRGICNGLAAALERSDAAANADAAADADADAAADAGGLQCQLRLGTQRWTIPFADATRSDARAALGRLGELGLASQIISGDRAPSVAKVAQHLGVEGTANASPQDKLALLEALRAQGRKTLMVGDGINDGPALAAAHASIAPSTASDASQQAADAVFIGDALMPVALAVQVAQRTMRVVRQNFAFAIGYNVLVVPLALLGFVTPLIAAIAMSISSLVVVGNSLRLARAAQEKSA